MSMAIRKERLQRERRERRSKEDEAILTAVRAYGSDWDSVALAAPGRTPDAVRSRFYRVLTDSSVFPLQRPAEKVYVESWCTHEDVHLIDGVRRLGFRWRQLAAEMHGRTP